MPNPRGINQYSKGRGGKSGGKSGSKKAPSLAAGRKKIAAAGFSGKLNTDNRFGARTASQKATAKRKRYASN